MTVAAIRDTMGTAVKAIDPLLLTGNRFREHPLRDDFRTWAEQNPQAAFRVFSIRRSAPIGPAQVTNTDVEWVDPELECVIAYPRDFRGGPQMVLDRDDLIESDGRQIRDTIGTNGYSAI